MGIIKLATAGESVTWHITQAETVAGKFGPQVKFGNDAGDILFIPQDSAMRQLERIGLEVAQCVGETLVIARDENKKGGAPYWSLKVAGAGEKQAAQPTKRLGSPYSQHQMAAQPFDEPTEDERYAKFEAAIAELAGEEVADPYKNAPAPAPIHNGTADLTQRAVNQYASVFALMDKALQKAYGAKVPPDTVQAATFSVWKRLSDKGVLS